MISLYRSVYPARMRSSILLASLAHPPDAHQMPKTGGEKVVVHRRYGRVGLQAWLP
jgi:hypothetical protein